MTTLSGEIERIGRPLEDPADLERVIFRAGHSRVVMIGEASHGTAEFYHWRARLTRRLLEEHGYGFVAVEGDWPDCYAVNRFVKGYDSASDAAAVLRSFSRWPTWMWANWETAAWLDWLRRWNAGRDHAVGFYGLDVYSLWESLGMIIRYLEERDPDQVIAAKRAFACFEPYGQDPRDYAQVTAYLSSGCEDEVIHLLRQLRQQAPEHPDDPEGAFSAQQNAHVLVNAEAYYRRMAEGGSTTWNIRDRHMSGTLNRLLDYHGPNAKGIVWAHNTHIGDARATDMSRQGVLNIGQLVREQHPGESCAIGFGSHRGEVVAAREWGGPIQAMRVPPAREESWEALLHDAGDGGDLLLTLDRVDSTFALRAPRDHRAIGVVYHPERERRQNYVPTILHQRYDAFLFIDESSALHPLHVAGGETPPQTYPWGF